MLGVEINTCATGDAAARAWVRVAVASPGIHLWTASAHLSRHVLPGQDAGGVGRERRTAPCQRLSEQRDDQLVAGMPTVQC